MVGRTAHSFWLHRGQKYQLVASTESEFLAVRRPKRVKNHGEKLYAPLVQNSEGKYSLQVKIFEFYPSDRTLVESTESKFSAVRPLKRVKNTGEKLYPLLVQTSEGKYSLQIKIFEFYPSGPECRGGTRQSAECHHGTSELRTRGV